MNFDQNPEILRLHFCANIQLCTQIATIANCLQIIDFFLIEMSSMNENHNCFEFDEVTRFKVVKNKKFENFDH